MKDEDENSRLTYTYWTLRNAVGWIGTLLPFVLMLGVFLIFGGRVIESSISSYYHTGMRDVFVGALCGIALFMFSITAMMNGIIGQLISPVSVPSESPGFRQPSLVRVI
jgi:hypothetical protein